MWIHFLLGVITGVFLLFTIISVLLLKENKKSYTIKIVDESKITSEEVINIVNSKYELFKENYKKGTDDENFIMLLYTYSYEIINEIASLYYPKSKYPIFELSFDELIHLNKYIIERLESLLGYPVLNYAKQIKLSHLAYLYDMKKKLDQSSINQIVKKYKLGKVASYGFMALNATNPSYWIRRVLFKYGGEVLTKQTINTTFSIVAEETVKVYSKSMFKNELKIDVVKEEQVLEIEG